MKRILLLLILSVCLLPLWPQETVTPVKPLSARIDALIEHKLPAGSNVAISVYDLTSRSVRKCGIREPLSAIPCRGICM